jgi:hypothetical protein
MPTSRWRLVDEGPPDELGRASSGQRPYEVREFSDSEEACTEAQRLSDERGHVVRVVKTFWPKLKGSRP